MKIIYRISEGGYHKDKPEYITKINCINNALTHFDEMIFTTVDSYYLLAINSLESKKLERLNLAMESYLKLVDLYPKNNYAQKAEAIYESCLKIKSNIKLK